MQWGQNAAAIPVERRAAEREAVNCPAVMRTPYSSIVGEISDISTGGARFEAASGVPGPAINVFLEWEGQEVFCRIIWSKHDACGVAFDKPIPEAAVGEAVEQTLRREPPAALGNIPLGTRRSRMRLAASSDEPEA